jgi:hypothetical protein
MKRRHVLKGLGTASALSLGATVFASPSSAETFAKSEIEYVTTEIDGETRQFTPEEFDRHPDTQSLSEVVFSSGCCFDCCECCAVCCAAEPCCCRGFCGTCLSC